MRGRASLISTTIINAILDGKDAETCQKKRSICAQLTHYMLNFFYIWHLNLSLYRCDDFLT